MQPPEDAAAPKAPLPEPPRGHVIVRRADAMRIVGLKSSAFDELRKRPGFPRPIWVTQSCPGWYADEIHTWLESLREAANG
jgi:predicted DNA-binding transcriptional regulator AlpA